MKFYLFQIQGEKVVLLLVTQEDIIFLLLMNIIILLVVMNLAKLLGCLTKKCTFNLQMKK